MRVKLILPALTEARSPFFRPIKYSLFPPLGLATLAAYLRPEDEATLVDEHVETIRLDDNPDLALIQVYITNARRAYELADHYRSEGCFVALGGLHVTALPDEAAKHADAIFLGPAEQSFPRFLEAFREGDAKGRYFSKERTLDGLPPLRRDLIKRELYLVPNSVIVSRGCPHRCSFCYKESFFKGGKSFYTSKIDRVLEEIESLPGRHLYFLDDHLLASPGYAGQLFDGLVGMNRVFQGAATVDSILRGDLIEKAAGAGLRSVFVGFETLNSKGLVDSNKKHNLTEMYDRAVERLDSLGIMINGSFVFGLDADGPDVFDRTVDWAVEKGIVTATFHILTPYPGTVLFEQLERAGRIATRDWDLYDTRHVVFKTKGMTAGQLRQGYEMAYRKFYNWSSIARSSLAHESGSQRLRHLVYTVGWKKAEAFWNLVIKTGSLGYMRPLLEAVLSRLTPEQQHRSRMGTLDEAAV